MRVEVVRAEPGEARCAVLSLPAGATVLDAVRASGFPHDGLFGVFGKPVEAGRRLADGDRVEIYRPLAMDPNDARRRRARGRARRS